MAYNDIETSDTDARPIELFRFEGTYGNYYMTSYAQSVTSGGQIYQPVMIKRTALRVGTQEQSDAALEIEIPFDHQMAQEYAYENAPPTLIMKLYRTHEQNVEDSVLLWNGRVTGFSVEGRVAKLRVPSLFSYILEGNTPNPRFQAPCNHVLYDARCGVDPADYQHITTITSMNGNVISVADLPWAENEGRAGAMIGLNGEQRMIMRNIGNSVTLSYSFSGLDIGDTVTLRKGCDHAMNGHCLTRFGNTARFGGFPLVPDDNPFTKSSVG